MEVSVLSAECAEVSRELTTRQRALDIVSAKLADQLDKQGVADSIGVLRALKLELQVELEEVEAMKGEAAAALASAQVGRLSVPRCTPPAHLPRSHLPRGHPYTG
jgi:hypothetical protein